ncbi:hypothetical protein DFI02_1353 [Rhizobium sp. PP-F2F-G20b]|nr:hypothetical protein DFI02_1353 [Rhizobium sp. PP-F2F-G20b]
MPGNSKSALYQPEGWTRSISPPAPQGAHIACFNYVARVWLRELKARDFRLWLFVLHDTLGRRRKHRHYHMSQLRDGVREGGVVQCRGTGLSENTLTLAMLGLGSYDLLKIRSDNGPGKWFEVNVDRCLNVQDHDGEDCDDDCEACRSSRPVARPRYAKRPDYDQFAAPPGAHIQAVRSLCSTWAPELSDSQLKVLVFLIDAVLGSNKDRGHYTNRQIMSGVARRDGTAMLNCGTGLSRHAVIDAIHDLEEMGLIEVETIGPGARVFRVNHGWEPTPENTRRRKHVETTIGDCSSSNVIEFPAKGGANIAEEGCKFCVDGVQTLRTSNKNNIHQLTEPPLITGSAPLAEEEVHRESIPTKGLTASRSRAEKPLTPQPPVPRAPRQPSAARQAVDALEAVWREAYAVQLQAGLIPANAPPAPWTASDRKQAQGLAKDWLRNGYDPARLSLFLAFIVRDWHTIIDQHNPPLPGEEPLSKSIPPRLWWFIICGFIEEPHTQAYLAAEPRAGAS